MRGYRLGRIAGVDVVADWSVVIVVLLITVSLGNSVLPTWHPGWSASLCYSVAASAAILLLASILLHELAHAVGARLRGMHIDRVTLFALGGVAQLRDEPERWSTEFLMALSGPLLSGLIGVACLTVAGLWAPVSADVGADLASALATLAPGQTLLLWLGQINVLIALFNLVPGLPLDGGRVLRAILWGITGNLRRATRYAAGVGRAFSALLVAAGMAMAFGVHMPIFGTGLVGGVWMMLIGWFLHNAAVMSYRRLLMRELLHDMPVAQVMRADFATVPSQISLQEFVDQHLRHSAQHGFPVVDSGAFAGMISIDDLARVRRERWPLTKVSSVMMPAGSVRVMQPDDVAADALHDMSRDSSKPTPVVKQGRVLGLVSREDFARLIKLYGDAELAR